MEDAIKDFVDDFNIQDCTRVPLSSSLSCENQRKVVKSLPNIPSDMVWILNSNLEDKCRAFHEMGGSSKRVCIIFSFNYMNIPTVTEYLTRLVLSRVLYKQRQKRDILFPGTNWCGSGFVNTKFKELGVNSAADRCCRQHDHCKYWIPPFSWKFHLFNFKFHTISHCRCDERLVGLSTFSQSFNPEREREKETSERNEGILSFLSIKR